MYIYICAYTLDVIVSSGDKRNANGYATHTQHKVQNGLWFSTSFYQIHTKPYVHKSSVVTRDDNGGDVHI